MSQNYYDLYIESVLELAETLVVKSEYSALQVNKKMLMDYGSSSFVESDPHTWKYYLNLSGEYHPTDTPITITSLDTLQPIVFNKTNLANHTATAKAYKYNSRFYRELVTTYPDQEQLILGVLYPVDINKLISAPDLSVVGYPPHLVEDNEISLIENINQWIRHFDERWNNKQFTLSDTLYGAAMMGIMYAQLVPLIINLRLRACKTSEAHSYHVRQYLASHGMLDVYLNQMTKKQALFFYRNITYIERNSGKQDTFFWLVDRVMTDRGLPLSEYTMKHDVSTMPRKLVPTVAFRKRLLNMDVASAEKVENFHTLSAVLDKEEPLAPGNREYRLFNEQKISAMFENSLSSVVGTKVLESSLIDNSDAVPYTLHSVLLNYWIYLSNKNLYTAYVRIRNPKTGELFSLRADNAYLYFVYAFCHSLDIDITRIPDLYVQRVQIDPMPSNADLMALADTKYIPESYATFIRSLQLPLESCTSVSTFKDYAERVHTSVLQQSAFISNQEHQYTRGLTHAMVSRMYMDSLLRNPAIGLSYDVWLTSNNIPFEDFSVEDWESVYKNIYEEVTGYKMTVTENVSNMQRAMINIMQQLSSYSIQFVADVNKSPVGIINWAAIRCGDFSVAGLLYYRLMDKLIHVLSGSVKSATTEFIDWDPFILNFAINNGEQNLGFHEIGVTVGPSDPIHTLTRAFMNIGTIVLDDSYVPSGNTARSYEDIPLMQAYYLLTDQEKAEVKDVYSHCFVPKVIPDKADINDFMLSDKMPGFQYLSARRDRLNVFNYFYVPQFTYHFVTAGIEVELDAFYPNNDPVDVTSLKLNTGNTTVVGIEYLSDVPIENTSPSAYYTGGWSYVNQFDPSLRTDTEYEVSGLTAIYAQFSPTFVPIVSMHDFEAINTVATKSFDLKYYNGEKSLNTVNVTTTKQLDAVTTTALVYTYPNLGTPRQDHLDALYDFYDTRTPEDMVDITKSYNSSGTVGTTDTKEYDTSGTTAHKEIPLGPYYKHISNLEDIDVVIISKTVNGFVNSQAIKGLVNFKVIMHTRSLNIFNWLLGSGHHDIAVVGITHVRHLSALYPSIQNRPLVVTTSLRVDTTTDFGNILTDPLADDDIVATNCTDSRDIDLVI